VSTGAARGPRDDTIASIVKPAILVLFAVSATVARAADPPQIEISNGTGGIRAQMLLPDAERGYYRGTRFDWSGVIANLEYKGHSYFGKWFEKYDPKIHDAIMGPVEEFRTNDSALGYDQAKPGETFVKIGVGVLRKPDEPAYKFSTQYEIVNGGKWRTQTFGDRVISTHTLTDSSGYAYVYTKTVRLVKGKPEMVIEHRLKNTGKRPFETSVYDHNFFVMDGQPSGPDFAVKFPFDVKTVADVSATAITKGNALTYVRELPTGESVYTELKGYGGTSKDYDIRVENTKEKIGAHIVGDKPLSKLVFWSIRKTVCPEAYVSMKVEPGKTSEWKITYEFYGM
jgi:hypothetical protein